MIIKKIEQIIKVTAVVMTLCATTGIYAQKSPASDVAKAEAQFVKMYNDHGTCAKDVISYVRANPQTLKYDFKKLGGGNSDVGIVTSPDGKLRFYSCNTHMGGTSTSCECHTQYDNGKRVVFDDFYAFEGSDEFEGGAWITDLIQTKDENGQPLYIAMVFHKEFGTLVSEAAVALQIVNGKLVRRLFGRRGGPKKACVGVSYNPFEWRDRISGVGMDDVINFDHSTNTLYVPNEDGEEEMTDRYDMYRPVGGEMRYVGTGGGYWLNPSLRDFVSLCGIYRTNTKIIRVDKLAGGTYRYVCWNKGATMKGKPELIINGGRLNKSNNTITFENGDFQYIVPERRNSTQSSDKLVIKKNGKIIQTSQFMDLEP